MELHSTCGSNSLRQLLILELLIHTRQEESFYGWMVATDPSEDAELPTTRLRMTSVPCLGLIQMSEVVMVMSETALLDQGSQESLVKNVWRNLKRGKTTTPNYPWTEYWFNRHWGQTSVFLVRTLREHWQEMHNVLRMFRPRTLQGNSEFTGQFTGNVLSGTHVQYI